MSTLLDHQLLFERSPDVLLVLLPDAPRFTMVAATDARLKATHTTRESLGRGLFELFPDNPDDPAADGMRNLRASLERVLSTRAPDTMAVQKYDIRGADGTFEVKHWSPKNIPVLSPEGEVVYVLHCVEDVTDLVRASEVGDELRGQARAMEREIVARSHELDAANRQLREANAKLGELDAAKTAFFSNVSHEFRTPLTLMLGPLEDALSETVDALTPPQRQRVELAHANALRLLKLVNALLDFSRIEAGRLVAHFAPHDVSQLTATLATMFHSALDRAGIRLVLDCPPLPEPLWVDAEMWERIVTNLVSNAFKFTFEGEIVLRVRDAGAAVTLEVTDTGVGIEPAHLPRVFERFYRVAGATGRTHEGTGIGLSLVHELVERHGGQVSVESAVGVGTTFRIEIPKGHAHLPPEAVSQVADESRHARDAVAHAAEAMRWASDRDVAHVRVEAPAISARPHVLVVDDHADLREHVSRALSPAYDVSTAPDGLAALEAAHARLPDLVVSDVMMPRLDGYGLVRALRADPATALLPVILLSARAGDDATVEGLDVGADDYLVKPFSARELLARVRTHLELSRLRRRWIDELERSNKDLDALAHSLAHDLHAPARAMGGFSRALREDYGGALDEIGVDYLARISEGADRMAAMVDALLQLARVSHAELRREPVHLSRMSAEIIGDLERAQPERRVTTIIADGLVTRGDPHLLRMALTNLIGNAWKYTSRRADAIIEIAREPGDDAVFSVRDNGAGFDMTLASRLFVPFQRLHAAVQFEGTGIGLATVHRIVVRHGGAVWARAQVDEGATFFVSLPGR